MLAILVGQSLTLIFEDGFFRGFLKTRLQLGPLRISICVQEPLKMINHRQIIFAKWSDNFCQMNKDVNFVLPFHKSNL